MILGPAMVFDFLQAGREAQKATTEIECDDLRKTDQPDGVLRTAFMKMGYCI
jgi:hypothetical protein